jgi:pimeloyl-ACP methyl ester carboxylesterase
MKNFIFRLTLALALCTKAVSYAKELPRSASFGASISDLNDSTKTVLHLPDASGTLIKKVFPGSSAEKAGFLINDVIVSVDGNAVENTAAFLKLLKKYHGGDNAQLKFYRNAKLQNSSVTFSPKPVETSNDFDIIYSSVNSGNNTLRTIITKPKENKIYPAVLLIGGVGCYSIDNISLPEISSIKMWTDSLTKNGFLTIRVEKTGIGDSQGIPCNECDFYTEKQGFSEGIKYLLSLPYVDKEKVFIAGFSIGGILAPLIAQQFPVKGIIVYGTVGRNWLEYEMDNSFRQQLLENHPADSIDKYMREEYIRLYGLFVEKKSPQQIINAHPETASHLFQYPMKIEYFQQVADVNIGELWMNTKCNVLAMHGASDFVSSANEHKLIAETVNRYHPGQATYIEIPDADHWSLNAENELASYTQQQTGLNKLPLITSLKWLKDNS